MYVAIAVHLLLHRREYSMQFATNSLAGVVLSILDSNLKFYNINDNDLQQATGSLCTRDPYVFLC